MLDNKETTKFVNFVRGLYQTSDFIPLHGPTFIGAEREYVLDTINSTFVSSVGKYVNRFEEDFSDYVGINRAVAVVNGTAALHAALLLSGVISADEVISPSLTFVASCNAIKYCQAEPIFVDISRKNLGICPDSLLSFLENNTKVVDGHCINQRTQKVIRACVVVHVFGFPADVYKIKKICDNYHIKLIEDASEALGSYDEYGDHIGKVGLISTFSFNGNKTITTGGGGMLVSKDPSLMDQAKHLTTTGKKPHQWNYYHDQLAYNYRLPNINAALGCAQLQMLPELLASKKKLALKYQEYFKSSDIAYMLPPELTSPNYWLNAIQLSSRESRDEFLKETNSENIMTRPVWDLMHTLPMYASCEKTSLKNSTYLADRIVNIPSTPIISL